MSSVGDLHNFGEFVYAKDEKVFKPRTLFWEDMFLNSESKLRILINSLCSGAGVVSPFEIAPELNFGIDSCSSGWVDRLALTETVANLSENEVQGVAAMIGLCYWFGIGDLHHENVFAGRNHSGRFICFPIDIEVVFDKMTHVNQTLLLPSERLPENKCGLGSVLEFIRNIQEHSKFGFLESFLNVINILNENSEYIVAKVLEMNSAESNYVRVILRDTKKYKDIIDGNLACDDLIEEEKVQIARKEIPYFFRRLNSDEIYFYKNSNKEIELVKNIPESTNKVTSITLNDKFQIDQLKTNTAIYSCAFLAEQIGMRVSYGLSDCAVYGIHKTIKCSYNEKIEVYEII